MSEDRAYCCVCGQSGEKAVMERVPHPLLQGAVKFRHPGDCLRRFSDKRWL